MLKKINLPILLTMMCALLLAVVLFYGFNTGRFDFLKNKTQKQVSVQSEEEKIKRTDYTEVARKTLDWIDKQRNESGWYILGKTCGQKDCEQVMDDKEVGNKDGLIATWARLNFYEQHQDPKDLEIVKKDIDLFYEKYKNDDLKDSLWICKITYEMAQSKYLDQAQKDKLKELCLKKDIISFDNQVWEKEKKDLGENNDFKKGMSFSYYFIEFIDLYYKFGDISDIFYKYKFTNDAGYLKSTKENLIKITGDINDENLNLSNRCLLGVGAIDLYKLSKSRSDLDYAVSVYDKVFGDEQLAFDPFCGLLIKGIYEVTSDNKYLIVLEKNNKVLIENYNLYKIDSFFVSPNTYPKRDIFMNGLFVEIIR